MLFSSPLPPEQTIGILEGELAVWGCDKKVMNYHQHYFFMHTDLEVSFQGQAFNTEERT